jgi:outer membrane protein
VLHPIPVSTHPFPLRRPRILGSFIIVCALSVDGSARADAPASLTLEDAVRLAREHHPAILAQKAQLAAAEARQGQARGAFLPALTGSFAYAPQTANAILPPSQGVEPTAGASPTSFALVNYWQTGIGLTLTVFDWGKTIYAYRAAGEHRDAQALSMRARNLEVVLDAKVAFFSALAAEAQLHVSEEALATRKRYAEIARSLFGIGSRTEFDVVSADSEVAAAELFVARATGSVQSARAQLLAALGERSWVDYRLVAPEERPEEPVLDRAATLETAVKERPEPRALAFEAESFSDVARSQRGTFLPQISVFGGPMLGGESLRHLTPNLTITLALSFPFAGMNPAIVVNQIAEAEASERFFVAEEARVENNVRREAAEGHAQLLTARQATASAEKLVLAARKRRDVAERRYQAGLNSLLELSDAQLGFVSAQFQQVQARFDLALARARLEKAMGRE